jgi:hypothetical protein
MSSSRSDSDAKPSAKKPRLPPIADLYLSVTNAMNREKWCRLPKFPRSFHTVEVDGGMPLIVEERSDGICRYVQQSEVTRAVLRYTVSELAGDDSYAWTADKARGAMEFWHHFTPSITAPRALLWADEPGLTFHRIPWLRGETPEAPPPLWQEILSRMTNWKAFCIWVGSVFDPKADLQQYVWLFGEGQNGKGAITRFLERALGPSYSSQQPPAQHDRFWTAGLLGKRLVVFPDCNNVAFVTSGLFKSLTGGDAQRVEEKGKPSYTARLDCKFLYSSNERPGVSSERADLRRAILCELGAIQGDADPGYEDRLWAEGGDFLRYCCGAYATQCPNGGAIPAIETESLELLASVNEEEYEAAFNRLFTYCPVDEAKLDRDKRFITAAEFYETIAEHFRRDKRAIREFRMWAERRYGLVKTRVRLTDTAYENRYLCVAKRNISLV